MQLDWSTLALQTVNVLVLLWLLRRYLFRPVMASVAARRQAADALLAEAAAQRAAAEATAGELARRAEDSVAEAERLRAAAGAAAEAERKRLLAEASAEIGKTRDAAAAAIRRDRAALRQELETQARALAVTIAARLLARLPGPAATAAMLAALEAELAALPAAQLHALAVPGAPLEVVSAAPLSEADRASCAALLAGLSDPPLPLRFSVDPALIAGIELRGGHAVLRQSWQAELARIGHELSLEDADVAPLLA